MFIIVEAHSDGYLFWIEVIARVKKIILRSLLDQIERAITMKSFILLCSYNFNCKRAPFQFKSNNIQYYFTFHKNLEEEVQLLFVAWVVEGLSLLYLL